MNSPEIALSTRSGWSVWARTWAGIAPRTDMNRSRFSVSLGRFSLTR